MKKKVLKQQVKRKDECEACKKLRVVKLFCDARWVCGGCQTALRRHKDRLNAIAELRLFGFPISESIPDKELQETHHLLVFVHYYVLDCVEQLSGTRERLGPASDTISHALQQLKDPDFIIKIANIQKERDSIAYSRMSSRQRDEGYSYMFLKDTKPPICKDATFRRVASVVRKAIGDQLPATPAQRLDWSRSFLADVPKGKKILVEEFDVAGTHRFNDEALAFCKGQTQSLTLARDSANVFDRNAVKIIAKYSNDLGARKEGQIGFIPAKLAAQMALIHRSANVGIILNRVWISEVGYIKIVCDLVVSENFEALSFSKSAI